MLRNRELDKLARKPNGIPKRTAKVMDDGAPQTHFALNTFISISHYLNFWKLFNEN